MHALCHRSRAALSCMLPRQTGPHSAIARAALDRDSDAAVALLTEHLQKTASVILDAAAAPGPLVPPPAGPEPLDAAAGQDAHVA